MINRSVSRCAHASPTGLQSRYSRRLAVETLEDRRQLSVTVSNVHLASDTGISATDGYTSNPAIAGNVSATNPCAIQIDDNGDGVIGSATISSGTFSYNPLANDQALQNFEGSINLRYRTIEYDLFGNVIATSGWTNFIFTLDRVGPSVDGLYDTEADENDSPTTVALQDGFHDGATTDSQLSFQVVGNTNASLFSSVSINSSGTLTLSYATNQSGDSDITIRATDRAGNYVNTTFTSWVYWVNQRATISNFTVTSDGGNYWTLSGNVADDTSPTGYVVKFGGIFASYNKTATVQANGSFSLTALFVGLQSGYASAQTADLQLLASNTAQYYV